jgi:hypothetical protein
MIMLSFNMAVPDLIPSRSYWAQPSDVTEFTVAYECARFPSKDGQENVRGHCQGFS